MKSSPAPHPEDSGSLAARDVKSFVYSVTHDLNNPLTMLLGYLELLDEELGPGVSRDVRVYLDRIRASATEMQELIKDLARGPDAG
ncbi:MAG: hypothetical protein M3238_08785 [Actinomycetota bacterium]|nr:hypothetical protein [Actinomycetota bacterium]